MLETKKMQAEEKMFDRIGQTFELFKDNFKEIIMPIFLYNFFTLTIFSTIITYLFVNYGKDFLQNFSNQNGLEKFEGFFYNTNFIIAVNILIILIILYLTFYIPFLIGTIKNIKQAYSGEKINCKKNIKYGFKNIGNSFKTYWYIFSYVALIPALIIILGGFFILYGMQFDNDTASKIGVSILSIGTTLFIIFSIYRGLKTTFSIISAVDEDDYTKENFKFSIEITKNNWWRILGNILFTSIILGYVIGMLQGYFNSFGSTFNLGMTQEISEKLKQNPEEIYKFISEMLKSYSPISNFLLNTINGFFNSLIGVFMLIFSYIFYKRLVKEKNVKIETNKEL